MNLQDHVSIIAQTENGQVFSQGMQHSDASLAAAFSDYGLMLLAHTVGADNGDAAVKTAEIILDDMQLNLPSAEQKEMTVSKYGSAASRCLWESLENVNEYLFSQAKNFGISAQNSGVSLLTMQFEEKQFSVAVIGDYSCLLINENNINNLTTHPHTSILLGAEITTQPYIKEQVYFKGDVILMIRTSVVQAIGQEFIRRTLSRFADSPDMALRQINTRMTHLGIEQKPSLVLCRIDRSFETKRRWFSTH